MSTPISANAAYATAGDFFVRVDWRVVDDYLGDEGQRYTKLDTLAAGTSPNVTLTRLMQEASGEVEAACLKGERYAVADLQILNGNSQQKLIGLVVDLALGKVLGRRADVRMPTPQRVEDARAMLDHLADGSAIFALQETADAGLPAHSIESGQDVRDRNLPSSILSRYMGRRSNRYGQPPGNG